MITSTIELRSTSTINRARRRFHHNSTDDIAEDIGSDRLSYRLRSPKLSAAIAWVIGSDHPSYQQRLPELSAEFARVIGNDGLSYRKRSPELSSAITRVIDRVIGRVWLSYRQRSPDILAEFPQDTASEQHKKLPRIDNSLLHARWTRKQQRHISRYHHGLKVEVGGRLTIYRVESMYYADDRYFNGSRGAKYSSGKQKSRSGGTIIQSITEAPKQFTPTWKM